MSISFCKRLSILLLLPSLLFVGCGKSAPDKKQTSKADVETSQTKPVAVAAVGDLEGVYVFNRWNNTSIAWFHVVPDGKGGWQTAELSDTHITTGEIRTHKNLFLWGVRAAAGNNTKDKSPMSILGWQPSAAYPGTWDMLGFSDEETNTDWPKDLSIYEKNTLELPTTLLQFKDNRLVQFLLNANPKPGSEIEATIAENLVTTARAMVAEHEDEPQYRVLLLHALTQGKRWPELRAELDAQKTLYENNRSLTHAYRVAQLRWESAQPTEAGRNAAIFLAGVLKKDFAGQMAAMPEFQKYDQYRSVAANAAPVMEEFLKIQVLAKTTGMTSILLLVSGDQKAALEVAAGNYALGQCMSQGIGGNIESLIGIALRAIAAHSLKIIALNAGESVEDMDAIREKVEALNKREFPYSSKSGSYYEPQGVYPELAGKSRFFNSEIDKELEVRHLVANAQFQLVRMGAVMRRTQLANGGALPDTTDALKPLFPGGLPNDPFTSNSLLLRPIDDGMVCYSVGPDKADGKALAEYDSTNGSTSAGDVIARIPRVREFPFPSKGIKASTRAEFLQQMPNGLPRDFFADKRARQLTITDTTPVFVYSFGPDCDESARTRNDANPENHGTATMQPNWFSSDTRPPDVVYDPTNGVTSKGDLFIAIPPSIKK
ncbi:TPA: hypothetical protein DDW35_10770 [Candidatus Sumerlaeota bacterium]|nr:hypothetical protein [Candidatus Sumerlaeota bacterium]